MIPHAIVRKGQRATSIRVRARRHASTVLWAAIALCGTATSLVGQEGRLLRGRVLADGELPPSSAMEILVTTDGIDSGTRIRTYADDDGFFTIRAIPSATYYDVRLEVDGFDPVSERVESAAFSGSVANVVLILRPTALIAVTTPRQPIGSNRNIIDLSELETEIPTEAYRLYELAVQDAQTGEFARAAGHLERVLQLAPRFYQAQNNLGVQYLRLGRLDEAIEAFERAIELGPNETQPRLNLAGIYLEHGPTSDEPGGVSGNAPSLEAAITLLREAAELDPDSAEVRLSLGTALYIAAAYDEASTELNHALDLAPDTDSAWLTLINTYTRGRRYDDALELIDRFLESRPNAPQRPALERIRSQIGAVPER